MKLLLNSFLFTVCTVILVWTTYSLVGSAYLKSSRPVGGDYFNFLTFAKFFKKYLPFPPTGWTDFYNEGQPIIGGYPWLGYYLMLPFTLVYDTATGMELFAFAFHILFFLSCLLLFAYSSRSWLTGLAFSLLTLSLPASHLQLFAGGFVIAATSQFYLPIALLFTLLYLDRRNYFWLILTGFITGLALMHHPPSTMIILFAPIFLILVTQSHHKLISLTSFVFISLTIGLPGIYSTFLQNFLGSGRSACANPECWGNYPRQFNSWLNYNAILISISVFLLIPFQLIFKKRISLKLLIPSLVGLSIHLLYGLFAYFHLINGAANVIFPIRFFWSGFIFLALASTQLLRQFKSNFPKISLLLPLMLLPTVYVTSFNPFPNIYKESPNTYPQEAPLSTIIPKWLATGSPNWRLDSINSGIIQWWNYASPIPSVRGYSNHPLGRQASWQYLLQSKTRNVQLPFDQKILTNQIHFLLDHYGIGYIDNTTAVYPKEFINNSQYIYKSQGSSDFSWHQTNPDVFSPILSGTNAIPVLFIGSDLGYETFMRMLSLTGLASQTLIPIKGPTTINSLDQKYLQFPIIFTYDFSGSNWANLTTFVNRGGILFLDVGNHPLSKPLPDLFPVYSLTTTQIQGQFIPGFADLEYNGGPWKLSVGTHLKPWAKSLIPNSDQKIYIGGGKFGQGQIVLSTFNFPYHLITTQNPAEIKFITDVFTPWLASSSPAATFTAIKLQPNHLIITSNSKGIYFKENYDSGWLAKTAGQSLQIYPAGLDFMYIPLPNSKNQTLDLRFAGNFTQWSVFIISILGILSTLPLLIYGPKFMARRIHKRSD